jgi:hypothetical protein
MLHTSPATLKTFQQHYDKYGDSFTQDVTEDELQHIFSIIGKVSEVLFVYTKKVKVDLIIFNLFTA